ncbi:hypothetical protein DYI24_12840 [Rhodopseudomonas sp. BR0C11]|uniref:hypothetical protein n=1 Tax=Rhodopseudomonas sp. BR0C11 TaxID=2269370 RepID=UPI0013DF9D0C|nr:hypothetical protein [Rhodopseudomonas sp. BR0C11]NEV77924.1 hypothetical protein [Rhodopseudomonas sp. BR0C11]
MSEITADNPHREYFPTHQLSYWRKGTACARDEADIVHLEQFVPGYGTRIVTKFAWPLDQYDLERISDALERAFEAGKVAKAEEITKALGLKR